MPKTRQEKIASYDEQISQLLIRKKTEVDKHKEDERKRRTKRLIERGGIVESLIAEAPTFTNDQIHTLLSTALATDTAKEILSEMREQNAKALAELEDTTADTERATASPKPAEPTGQNTAPQPTKPTAQPQKPLSPSNPKQGNTPPQNPNNNRQNNGNHANGNNQQHQGKQGNPAGQNG